MRLKQFLWAVLAAREPAEPPAKPWTADTQCARLLKALCEGHTMGGREACLLLHSHNGDRRLRQVRARLRAPRHRHGHEL